MTYKYEDGPITAPPGPDTQGTWNYFWRTNRDARQSIKDGSSGTVTLIAALAVIGLFVGSLRV